MRATVRKWPTIDIVKLRAEWTDKEWMELMQKCFRRRDIKRLESIIYGLNAGMDEAAKKKLNDDKLIKWYLWAMRCTEKTAKQIFRTHYPHELNNPLTAQRMKKENPPLYRERHALKKKLDNEFEFFIRKTLF